MCVLSSSDVELFRTVISAVRHVSKQHLRMNSTFIISVVQQQQFKNNLHLRAFIKSVSSESIEI